MKWFKIYREDLDSPAFQAGIERFGTGFVHDVLKIWQLLCTEEGPGARILPLTDDAIRWLASRLRCDPHGVRERLDFMHMWRLVNLEPARGQPRSRLVSKRNQRGLCSGTAGEQAGLNAGSAGGQCGVNAKFVLRSRELERRRDEWTRRKLKEQKKKTPAPPQEQLRRPSGDSPAQESESESESDPDPDSQPDWEAESESKSDDRSDRDCPSRLAFKSETDLYMTMTARQFDPKRGFKDYGHRGSFFQVVLATANEFGVPETLQDVADFMTEVVDRCEDEEKFKAPPGWMRVLGDIRRELQSAQHTNR